MAERRLRLRQLALRRQQAANLKIGGVMVRQQLAHLLPLSSGARQVAGRLEKFCESLVEPVVLGPFAERLVIDRPRFPISARPQPLPDLRQLASQVFFTSGAMDLIGNWRLQ